MKESACTLHLLELWESHATGGSRWLATTLADHRQLGPSIIRQVEGVLEAHARLESAVLHKGKHTVIHCLKNR